MGLVSLLFSFHGRITRRQYWTGNLMAGFVGMLAVVVGVTLAAPSPDASKKSADVAQMLATFGLVLIPVAGLLIWCGLAIQVKRLHDRGRSGLLSLIPLLPAAMMAFTVASGVASGLPAMAIAAAAQPYSFVLWLINLGFFIDLGCLGSREGANKYGDPPGARRSLKLDETPRGSASAGFQLGSADKAIERAIADRSRPAATAAAAVRPSAPLQPRPASATPSFGRRAAP